MVAEADLESRVTKLRVECLPLPKRRLTAPNVVAGTLLLNHLPVFVLFYSRATHSFIAYKTIEKLGMSPYRVFMGFTISTPLRERVDVDIVYKNVRLFIMRCELSTDLIPLPLHNFDIILGMDWLGRHRAQMNCFAKTITFCGPISRGVVFRGERNVIPNYFISAMTT